MGKEAYRVVMMMMMMFVHRTEDDHVSRPFKMKNGIMNVKMAGESDLRSEHPPAVTTGNCLH